MHMRMDEPEQQISSLALRTEGERKETVGQAEGSDGSEEFVRHKSPMLGMKMALPLALWLWALIGALIWVWRR